MLLSLILCFAFFWIRFCYQKSRPNMILAITESVSNLTLTILNAKYRLAAVNLPPT